MTTNLAVTEAGYAQAEAIRFAAVATAANIKAVAAVAQFILSAQDAINNFKKLRNIASRGLTLEEQQQAFLENNYWPKEKAFLTEHTTPTVWESRPVLAKRYAGRMWAPFANQMGRELHKLSCDRGRYCGNAYKRKAQEITSQFSLARANITLLADRIAESEIEAVRDTDWERRAKAIAVRQGLIGQAVSLMAEAQRGFAGAAGNAVGGLNNAITSLGYLWGQRNDARNGVGADPVFHRRVAQRMGPPGVNGLGQDYDIAPQYAFDDASTQAAASLNSVSNFDASALSGVPGVSEQVFSSYDQGTPGLGVDAASTPFTGE